MEGSEQLKSCATIKEAKHKAQIVTVNQSWDIEKVKIWFANRLVATQVLETHNLCQTN